MLSIYKLNINYCQLLIINRQFSNSQKFLRLLAKLKFILARK